MALLVKNFTHNGETYPEAYVKIAPVFPPVVRRIILVIWASKAAHDAKATPCLPYGSIAIMPEQHDAYFSEDACKPEGATRWSNAYAYAKTLVPQYRDATDC